VNGFYCSKECQLADRVEHKQQHRIYGYRSAAIKVLQDPSALFFPVLYSLMCLLTTAASSPVDEDYVKLATQVACFDAAAYNEKFLTALLTGLISHCLRAQVIENLHVHRGHLHPPAQRSRDWALRDILSSYYCLQGSDQEAVVQSYFKLEALYFANIDTGIPKTTSHFVGEIVTMIESAVARFTKAPPEVAVGFLVSHTTDLFGIAKGKPVSMLKIACDIIGDPFVILPQPAGLLEPRFAPPHRGEKQLFHQWAAFHGMADHPFSWSDVCDDFRPDYASSVMRKVFRRAKKQMGLIQNSTVQRLFDTASDFDRMVFRYSSSRCECGAENGNYKLLPGYKRAMEETTQVYNTVMPPIRTAIENGWSKTHFFAGTLNAAFEERYDAAKLAPGALNMLRRTIRLLQEGTPGMCRARHHKDVTENKDSKEDVYARLRRLNDGAEKGAPASEQEWKDAATVTEQEYKHFWRIIHSRMERTEIANQLPEDLWWKGGAVNKILDYLLGPAAAFQTTQPATLDQAAHELYRGGPSESFQLNVSDLIAHDISVALTMLPQDLIQRICQTAPQRTSVHIRYCNDNLRMHLVGSKFYKTALTGLFEVSLARNCDDVLWDNIRLCGLEWRLRPARLRQPPTVNYAKVYISVSFDKAIPQCRNTATCMTTIACKK
jgi:hypothetical protein